MKLQTNLNQLNIEVSNLDEIWERLVNSFFPSFNILDYKMLWSGRPQKRTLASCNIRHRRVKVARELQDPEFSKWLEPLLYHEMCHAIINEIYKPGEVGAHGSEFKALERIHPLIKDFNLWLRAGGWARAIRKDRGRRSRLSVMKW